MHRLTVKHILLCLGLLLAPNNFSQTVLSLEDVVKISRCDNLSARRAYVEKKSAYWNWQIHRSNLRPQFRLNTRLTDFTKGVTPVSQEDGSILIKTVNQNASNASLTLQQPLSFLGADVFMNSTLYRFDNFSSSQHSYSSQPIELGIRLPVFQFNQLKWDKRIKPLVYLESNKEYDRDLEMSTYISVDLFFQNLRDRHEWSMAKANRDINAELFRISEEKYQQGRISKDELLQVKLMMINARKSLEASRVNMENSSLRLLTQLSLTNMNEFTPLAPPAIPALDIIASTAIEYARENNPESISFKRRLLEAAQEVARTRGTTGITGDVFATMGYGSNFNQLAQWQDDLNQHANLQVGLSIPILDWGRTHAARKQASIRRELEETTVLQEQINFEKEIVALVNTVRMLKENIVIVAEAETIAMQRYEIAYKRYLAGDISILELDMAQKEKDYASRDLLNIQGRFWVNYHRLRMVTLYDFIAQQPLVNNTNHAL